MNKPFAKYPLGAPRLMLTVERLFGEMGLVKKPGDQGRSELARETDFQTLKLL